MSSKRKRIVVLSSDIKNDVKWLHPHLRTRVQLGRGIALRVLNHTKGARVSVGRKVVAIGSAALASSLGVLVTASVVSRWFSETGWIGQVAMFVAIGLGIGLGLTLWFVVVRRLNLFSWDELDEYLHIEEYDDPDSLGFTLIEVLVVIVVIALLASLVAPNVFRHLGTAKDATARSQIQMLGAALDAYRLDNGRYPTTEQGLEALSHAPGTDPHPPNWRGPYLRGAIPADPWGNAYVYRTPSSATEYGFDLLSLGADGQEGGDGDAADIRLWEDP